MLAKPRLIMTFMLIILLFIPIDSTGAKLSDNVQLPEKVLDEKLYERLKEAGFTDEQIVILPDWILKDLKKSNKIEKINSKFVARGKTYYNPQTRKIEEIVYPGETEYSTQSTGDLDMQLWGGGWKVDSDRPGKKKILLVANYNWNSLPSSRFTDMLTMGWPSSTGWYLATSNGNVQQFSARDTFVSKYASPPTITRTTSIPYDAEPNAGIAHDIDLPGDPWYIDFYGGMTQYVYVDSNKTGSTNVKIEYGHSKLSFIPSISVYPAGLGISPSINVTKEWAMFTLENW